MIHSEIVIIRTLRYWDDQVYLNSSRSSPRGGGALLYKQVSFALQHSPQSMHKVHTKYMWIIWNPMSQLSAQRGRRMALLRHKINIDRVASDQHVRLTAADLILVLFAAESCVITPWRKSTYAGTEEQMRPAMQAWSRWLSTRTHHSVWNNCRIWCVLQRLHQPDRILLCCQMKLNDWSTVGHSWSNKTRLWQQRQDRQHANPNNLFKSIV